jgi:prevent-host-death family protein
MRRVKIAELKDKLSEHLRAVEKGGEVIVTDRDRPIAHIGPVQSETRLTILPPKRPFAALRVKKWRKSSWSVDSSSLLATERNER